MSIIQNALTMTSVCNTRPAAAGVLHRNAVHDVPSPFAQTTTPMPPRSSSAMMESNRQVVVAVVVVGLFVVGLQVYSVLISQDPAFREVNRCAALVSPSPAPLPLPLAAAPDPTLRRVRSSSHPFRALLSRPIPTANNGAQSLL